MGGWGRVGTIQRAMAAGIVAGLPLAVIAQTPSLMLITPPSGEFETRATGVSADGRMVSGYSQSSGARYGFSWSASGGIDDFGHRADVPRFTLGNAISGNGSVVVGETRGAILTEAFRYSGGTYQTLGVPAPGNVGSRAHGVNNDGSVIVGATFPADGTLRPMRWTAATGMREIPLPGSTPIGGYFTGVSRDGSTAIGISGPDVDGAFSPYTWSEAGGWTRLTRPASIPSSIEARALGVNFDGSLVAGYVEPTSGPSSAVLWRNGVPQVLPSFGAGWGGGAGGISDDGRVVVGACFNNVTGVTRATLWMNGTEVVDVQNLLASLGQATPAGWTLYSCQGVSADGNTIVGLAFNTNQYRAFVATIPSPSALVLVAIGGVLVIRRTRAKERS